MLLFAADGGWLNYPGLELWKFVNLTIFLVLGIIFLRKRINRGLLARRDSIQQELIAAQTEREQALARVAEADSLLSRLPDDVRTVAARGRLAGCDRLREGEGRYARGSGEVRRARDLAPEPRGGG